MYEYEEFDWADYPVTLILSGLNIGIYLALTIIYPSTLALNKDAIYDWGQINDLILQGELWRLVTPLFVHGSVVHLMSNMLFLFIFGMRCEETYGSTKMAIGYFAAGLGGNLFSLLILFPYISVGASGAVFGIFGMNLMLLRHQDKQAIKRAMFLAFIFFIFTISPNTNVISHALGLGIGLGIGYYWTDPNQFKRQKLMSKRRRSQLKREKKRHRR